MAVKLKEINLESIPPKGCIDYVAEEVINSRKIFDMFRVTNVRTSDAIGFYEELASRIGKIRSCNAVNDEEAVYSKSRDIKPSASARHFYASNTRQPLHTDYAYYPAELSPEWLMLYCIQPSEYGGRTQLISVEVLCKILNKYNPKLLKSLDVLVTWRFKEQGREVIHEKPILHDGKINWNYWQIDEELNPQSVINVKQDFFEFLEKVVEDGRMQEVSHQWSSNDCLIFNDQRVLHGRSAFLGQRWLKDHALYE